MIQTKEIGWLAGLEKQKTAIDYIPGGSDGKESTCNAGDLGSITGLGRSPGGWHGNPLQYMCLENPHGQRSLAGYSSWCCKESDTTEWLSTAQRLNSDVKTHKNWKWRNKKRFSMQVEIRKLKICFKTKTVTSDKRHCITIKGSIKKQDIKLVNTICVCVSRSVVSDSLQHHEL